MYAVISVILMLILFSVAVSCLMGKFWLLFFKPKKLNKQFCVVFLNSEDDERQMTYYCEKLKWYGKFFANKLVFVYRDYSPCLKNLANKTDNVIYCSATEWIEFLKEGNRYERD